MEITLLNDIVVIFAVAVAVLLVCHRLGVPTIIGYLITGALAGPHGLGLVSAVHEVEILAEIGIVLLLFTIGIEFSLRDLLRIKRQVLGGGFLQVALTIAAVAYLSMRFDLPLNRAVFVGFLVSLSSTAIVLKILQERALIDSPHGRLSLAILIFQDIAIVPMMLFTPLLAGGAGDPGRALLILAAKGAGIIVLVLVSAEWLVPRLMGLVARTRSRELFLLCVAVLCFAVAWLTSEVGLSLALGAFLAGLIISESEYSHQALGNIMPLRDIFTSFFFVSIGMLLDVGFLAREPLLVLACSLAVLGLNTAIATLASLVLGYPLRIALIAGLSLAQIGEFSFVLSRVGLEHGLLDASTYQLFLAVSVLTMIKTPFIITWAPRLADACARLPWPRRLKEGLFTRGLGLDREAVRLEDHLIIAGFGINGRNVARAARASGIPYVVVEMNPETVNLEKGRGESIFYGDASQEAVLEHAGVRRARVLVATVPDPAAVRRTVVLAHQLNPGLHIVARTRFVQEMAALYELGAAEVIPEEFETSVALFTRVLGKYLVPRASIEQFVAEIRADGYGLFRDSATRGRADELEPYLHGLEISALRVEAGAPALDRTLADIGLRRRYGATLLAASRSGKPLPNPDGSFAIHQGDVLVVLSTPEKMPEVAALFCASAGHAPPDAQKLDAPPTPGDEP